MRLASGVAGAATGVPRRTTTTSSDRVATLRFDFELADPGHLTTIIAAVKRVDSVEGLVCLPWHKDCERGGHSMFCSGLTIGICLTPVDVAHGGLDVVAGSHRANIARTQVDRGLDLPRVTLRADRGDLTVHMSCALHRSTHPTSRELRVAYTGFALPPRPGDEPAQAAQPRLRRERAAIGDPGTRAQFGPEPEHRGAP